MTNLEPLHTLLLQKKQQNTTGLEPRTDDISRFEKEITTFLAII